MRSAGIVGLGKALPAKVLTNFDLEQMVDTSDEWIFERTGIRQRRVSSENETSASLGAAACKEALAHANVAPEDVDLIICATTSPDMLFPSTACLIQQSLGCWSAAAFDVAAACSGFVYALTIASQFVSSGAYSRVLVVGVDVLTKFTDFTDRGTCILFGDGAGAAVVAPVEEGKGVLGFDMGSDGGGARLLEIPAGGGRHPATLDTVNQRQHFIRMEGREVFKFAVKIMGESAQRALDRCGLSSRDVDWLIPHQANTRIIDSAMRHLDIPVEKVYVNVERYGNTSAGSIPIALHEAYHEGKLRDDDCIVIVGFGAGLTWASCVLVWSLAPLHTSEPSAPATACRME
ncbi:MAG: ketoacyl-ACP synthase III [Armatimonadetes bacterium]|nr:ketoacyl-ACP synthase III [Armatimonadota bacterium]